MNRQKNLAKIIFWVCVLGFVLIGGFYSFRIQEAGPAKGPAAEEPKEKAQPEKEDKKPGPAGTSNPKDDEAADEAEAAPVAAAPAKPIPAVEKTGEEPKAGPKAEKAKPEPKAGPASKKAAVV